MELARLGRDEPLDELERGLRDLLPAVVDGQRVAAVGHLLDLGDARVAFLPLVGGVGDRQGTVWSFSPSRISSGPLAAGSWRRWPSPAPAATRPDRAARGPRSTFSPQGCGASLALLPSRKGRAPHPPNMRALRSCSACPHGWSRTSPLSALDRYS